jgi:hypothetical protein
MTLAHGQETGQRILVTFRIGAGETQGDFDAFR